MKTYKKELRYWGLVAVFAGLTILLIIFLHWLWLVVLAIVVAFMVPVRLLMKRRYDRLKDSIKEKSNKIRYYTRCLDEQENLDFDDGLELKEDDLWQTMLAQMRTERIAQAKEQALRRKPFYRLIVFSRWFRKTFLFKTG